MSSLSVRERGNNSLRPTSRVGGSDAKRTFIDTKRGVIKLTRYGIDSIPYPRLTIQYPDYPASS